MPPTFEQALAHGREIEKSVAVWLMARGCRILPVYDYSGLGDGKAPKLEAFSASESIVTPDLLVARNGKLHWCEVKWKSEATFTRINQTWETGISLRLWEQYRLVKRHTGARVWLVFAQEAEGYLTCDEIGALEAMPPRIYPGAKMGRGGMVFWPLASLTHLAAYSAVIPTAA